MVLVPRDVFEGVDDVGLFKDEVVLLGVGGVVDVSPRACDVWVRVEVDFGYDGT